jgi:hypothetical protein
MKIDEVLKQFEIFTSKEEREILSKMEGIRAIEMYNERERFIIENLVRKSLVSKVQRNNTFVVMKNDNS